MAFFLIVSHDLGSDWAKGGLQQRLQSCTLQQWQHYFSSGVLGWPCDYNRAKGGMQQRLCTEERYAHSSIGCTTVPSESWAGYSYVATLRKVRAFSPS